MAGSPSFGIVASAAYLPRWRIERRTITEAMGWTRGRARPGKGTRSFAHWDEDALTMAVEACRAVTAPFPELAPQRLVLASTSLPFADRSQAGVAREALNLPDTVRVSEAGGSRRAGTTALGEALEAGIATLLCASECVDTQPGSEGETEAGHGAGAVLLGDGELMAEFLGWQSRHDDFLDRYRQADRRFDYRLEARWARDAGIRSLLGELVQSVLADAGLAASDVAWFLAPFAAPVVRTVMKDQGLEAAATAAELDQQAGLCGAAHPLLMLEHALTRASAGEHILLVGAGQGFDVLLFRATGKGPQTHQAIPVEVEDNYNRYLGLRGLIDVDGGMRAERDNRSSQAAAHRRHAELHGLLGGRCTHCDKLQFPRAEICVHCHHAGPQALESMANLPGEVNSFTEDWLAWTPRPPLIFGNVHFPGGANIMMEFTDFEAGELQAGQAVRLAFRIKDFDDKRGFRRYFWKPAPVARDTEQAHG